MRKFILLLLVATLLLTACSSSDSRDVLDIDMFGTAFTVDLQRETVTDGFYVYQFDIEDDTVTVTYPNGIRYWQQTTHSGTTSGWDEDYNVQNFPFTTGDRLIQVIVAAQPKPKTVPPAVVYTVLALLGAWYILFPKLALHMIFGWLFKNSTPPFAAQLGIRLFGCLILAVDAYLIFF